jgi:cyclopropane-fatty-acyl-phospholipid synthase
MADMHAQALEQAPELASYNQWLERDLFPDWMIRAFIRRLCAERLKEESASDPVAVRDNKQRLVEQLRRSPIALNTAEANEQHYEVPTEFFNKVLGKRMKYSSALYPTGGETLDQAEEEMLDVTMRRARLEDGQDVLELGCGWGSLTLSMAERFRKSRITGVSNSRTQKLLIESEAAKRGLNNVRIITADMNAFEISETFDRLVSVEMFEHMRNYQRLLEKLSQFTRPGGSLFVHIFTHKSVGYPFEVKGPNDWMAKYFFTGGLMPSDDLLYSFQDHFRIADHWFLNGTHYEKTSNHWLENMDHHREAGMRLFAETYGNDQALKWWVRWRVFFMACAELFGYHGGTEWGVSHYLLEKR